MGMTTMPAQRPVFGMQPPGQQPNPGFDFGPRPAVLPPAGQPGNLQPGLGRFQPGGMVPPAGAQTGQYTRQRAPVGDPRRYGNPRQVNPGQPPMQPGMPGGQPPMQPGIMPPGSIGQPGGQPVVAPPVDDANPGRRSIFDDIQRRGKGGGSKGGFPGPGIGRPGIGRPGFGPAPLPPIDLNYGDGGGDGGGGDIAGYGMEEQARIDREYGNRMPVQRPGAPRQIDDGKGDGMPGYYNNIPGITTGYYGN